MRPTLIIFYRELLRWWRNKLRIISGLMMPFIWLVMFGSGISSAISFSPPGAGGFNYVLFLFPGVLGINILFTALFSAISTVRDREFGFLKEIFVAPIPRASIALGKILGGATVAALQGMLMIILLPLVHITLSWKLLILVPFIFLFSLAITALAAAMSARIRSAEGFQMVMTFFTFPMFMLSGALFPIRNVPSWMRFISELNPASYGVDMIRKAVFSIYQIPDFLRNSLSMTLFGHTLNLWSDINILLSFTATMIIISTALFAREDT